MIRGLNLQLPVHAEQLGVLHGSTTYSLTMSRVLSTKDWSAKSVKVSPQRG